MNPYLLGILGGVGQAGTALAQQRKEAAELERQRARDALLDRQITEQGRHNLAVEGAQQTDVPMLFKALGLPAPEGVSGPLPNTTANALITQAQKNAEVAADTKRAEGLRESIIGTGVIDPRTAALAAHIPYLSKEGRDKAALELYTRRPEPGFTVGPGQTRFGPDGNPIASVPALPTKETEGGRRTAEIHSYLQNVRKLTPGTPEYETEFMNWRNRPLTIFPGGEGYKATDFLGGGPPTVPGAPAQVQPKPTVKVAPNPPAVGTEATANLADFRTLLGQLDRVEQLYSQGASQYTGPVQGRLGAARNLTGIGASEAEADYRAELASIQNSIIYLKSGKQINEQEYERLRRELPEANDPEPVFKAKLARSRRLIQTMLSNREAEFGARGYRGSAPNTTTPPPPAAPKANEPSAVDLVGRANAIAKQRYGKPYGSLDDATRRAIFEEVKRP